MLTLIIFNWHYILNVDYLQFDQIRFLNVFLYSIVQLLTSW